MSRNGTGRGNWGWAAVLIAVGVVGLLSNFGLIDRPTLQQLWKLWPVIPLAIGVGILIQRSGSDRDRP